LDEEKYVHLAIGCCEGCTGHVDNNEILKW